MNLENVEHNLKGAKLTLQEDLHHCEVNEIFNIEYCTDLCVNGKFLDDLPDMDIIEQVLYLNQNGFIATLRDNEHWVTIPKGTTVEVQDVSFNGLTLLVKDYGISVLTDTFNFITDEEDQYNTGFPTVLVTVSDEDIWRLMIK